MQKEWIDEGVKNFNEGNREVIVYYDPKDPSNAVLFTGKTLFMNIVILIYGLVIIVVFLYFILNKISNKPQKSADQVKEHYTSS